ncbi:MAG TPA: PEP-CTERM sorting domain-containing protein [Rariglobus sp.]|jgi:hypothetical protein|nr:PEP-CTERM sorting domain-containing protein [Rariglobus sp.]
MNTPAVITSGSAKGCVLFRLFAGMMVASCFVSVAFAAGVTWSGATDTNFETGTNWGGTAPTNDLTTDYGIFTGTPTTNQPALTANRSIGGLQFGSTGGWALSGAYTLTLGNVLTVGSTTGVAVDASALTSGTDTISGGTVSLGSSAKTWLVGTGGTLNVTSTVKGTAGVQIAFGDASNAGTLIIGGTGDNSYLGLTLSNGVVQLNKTSTSANHALGGNVTINGGTLQLAGTGGDQLYAGVNVAVNGGTFDANGRDESFSQLTAAAAGGTTTNASGTASTLTMTGGGSYAGAFTGNLSLVVGGGGVGGSTFSGSINNAGTITNNGTGTGSFNVSGSLGANVTSLVQSSTTSKTVLTGDNSAFIGSIVIKAGTVQVDPGSNATASNRLGTGAITIGDSVNTGVAATLNINPTTTVTYGNTISTTGTGLATINLANYYATFTNAITLGSNLALTTTNNNQSTFTFSGAIGGTGNLTTQVGGTNATSSIILSNTVNNAGTITNSGSNTVGAATTITGNIGSNVTGVIQNSATSPLNLRGTNSFTGGITIKAGTVNVQGKALGADNAHNVGTITLGDVANTGLAATLNVANDGIGSSGAGNNAINVVGTGTRTISVTSFNPNFSGAVTLNGTNLNVITNNAGGSSLTVSGGITGTGNLVLQSNATLSGSFDSNVILSGAAINNSGTITNSGTGSIGTRSAGAIDTKISASIGSNVTQVIQNSANSALILSGSNSYGQTLVSLGTLSTSGAGTFGTGDIRVNAGGILTLGNNASISDAANVVFDSTLNTGAKINLNFTAGSLNAETIYTLTSISGTNIGPGTYDATALNTYFGSTNVFAGTGSLTILAAIPEPSTYAAIFGALALGYVFWRRRLAGEPV